MPTILELLRYIIYITSHDYGEPLHVHAIPNTLYGKSNMEKMASKIWIGENGATKIAKYGTAADKVIIDNIAMIIYNDKDVFNKIKNRWCELFQITEDGIEFYNDVPSIPTSQSKCRHR